LRGGGENCEGLKKEECEDNDDCQYVASRWSQNLKKKQYKNEDGKLMTNDGNAFCMSINEPEIDRKTGFTTYMWCAVALCVSTLVAYSIGPPTTMKYPWWDVFKRFENKHDTTATVRIAKGFRRFDGLPLLPGSTSALVRTGQQYAAADAALAGAMTAAGTLWFVGITHPGALAIAAVTKGLLRFGVTKKILELESLPKRIELYGTFYVSVLEIGYLCIRNVVQGYHVQNYKTNRDRRHRVSINRAVTAALVNYVEVSSNLVTMAVQGITDAMKEASWLQGVVLLVLGGFGWSYIASILNTVRGIMNSITTGRPVPASIKNEARDADLARRRGQQGRLGPIVPEENLPPGQICECILQSGPSKNQRCTNAANRKINDDRWVCGKHKTCTFFVAQVENADLPILLLEEGESSSSSEDESSSEESGDSSSSSEEEKSEDGDSSN